MPLPETLMGELIGEEILVVKSSDRKQAGTKGVVIDETLNTFVIETPNGLKTIEKKTSVFHINGLEIKGEDLRFRPEDRIKKYWRKFDATMRRQKLPRARKP
jgi:RNase P/RNase MRP subunit p29